MPLMREKNKCAKIQGRSGSMIKPSWVYSVCLLIQQFLAALRTPYPCKTMTLKTQYFRHKGPACVHESVCLSPIIE